MRRYNYKNVNIRARARVIRNGPARYSSGSSGGRSNERRVDRETETGWSSFKQSEDVSQIRRTCVRRRTRGACAATSKFLRAARAESLISQQRLDTEVLAYSHAGCSRSWRWSDVTDTWDSSRAAGSRAAAGREANLNANQELATPRDAARISNQRSRLLDFDCFSFSRRPSLFTRLPSVAVQFT